MLSGAAKAGAATIIGQAEVIDTAHLAVNGREIALQGLVGLGGSFAANLAGFIRAAGGTVTCTPLQKGYACRAGGVDVALAALINGEAKTSASASPAQIAAQQQAQAAHRDVWR